MTSDDTPPRFSLAEIDAQCRKAARGAGCPWGLAEEAGKAARWLASRGLPGPEALAALLSGSRACPCGAKAGAGAEAPDCALERGVALSDGLSAEPSGTMERPVAQPLLVLAQAGLAAEATGAPVAVEWDGFRAVCAPGELRIEREEGMGRAVASAVAWEPGEAGAGAARRGSPASRPVDAAAWARLGALAARTYAPASDASRLSGAGAGLSDND